MVLVLTKIFLVFIYAYFTLAFTVYAFVRQQFIFQEFFHVKSNSILGLIIVLIIAIPTLLPSQILVFICLCIQYLLEFVYVSFFSMFDITRTEVLKWYDDIKQNRKWFFLF